MSLVAASRLWCFETASAIALETGFGPVPYLGSDGYTHLSYEVGVTNLSFKSIRLDKIEILDDAERGRVLRTIEGEGVPKVMTLIAGGPDTNQLESSQTGMLYLDAWFPPDQATPAVIVHRISGTHLDDGTPMVVVTGARMRVRTDITVPVLQRPAAGTGWVSVEACCGRSHHRRTPISINGELYAGQLYAIDFVRLVDGQLFSGDPFVLSNWHVYGVELLAVADGVVTAMANDQPEWPVGTTGIKSKKFAGGNHVIVDMGNGMSYVFAHMQTGSVRVRVGDRVTAGQLIGLSGNSGITGAPHLHMHVISGHDDIFYGRGIPWAFDHFTVTGYFPTLTDLTPEEPGPPVNRVDVTPYEVDNAYPMELQVIDF